jgi:hypothetical protein
MSQDLDLFIGCHRVYPKCFMSLESLSSLSVAILLFPSWLINGVSKRVTAASKRYRSKSGTADAKEGMSTFMEKRKPLFNQ